MARSRGLVLLAIGSMLGACNLARPVTFASPPTPTPTPAPTATPAPDPGASGPGCYYVWATQELPGASQIFQRSMQMVANGATASAYAFGEDCVEADGTRRFSAMETDFRVRIPVANLKDEAAMGDLVAATMRAVGQVPPDQLSGPQAGRVEFEFFSLDGNSLRLHVDIDQYRRQGQGLSGAAVFDMFYIRP